uniref:Erythrocyte binding protein-like protein n=1 Tax=Oryza sativa subsp. japonica TaxID=39947 RepID=Q6ZAA2_ORYSJ|nr:erythrocyte binding protein-like protein [Oryza sativa Japonica Group]BAD09827.1 erythrocyte binding protein-like protein [Oryza sativa Japonica Group]
MARGSALLDGSVLPPSRIVSERQAGLPRRFMPESATGREIVTLGEGRPAPDYPGRSVFFLPFAMAGLVPPFSSFFMDVLEFYDLQMAHLTPNAVMTLAIFAHLCEMFIGVRPSLRLFRWFFTVQSVSPPSVVGGCYFQPRGPVLNRYIPCALRKKWDDWKSDWFYTPLADEARLRLPSQPPAQASSWRAPVDLGDGYDAVLDRLAGLRSQGLTGAMVYGDYLRRRIAPLQRRARGAWEYTGSEDFMRTHQGASLIPQGILPLCSDPDCASILTIMMAVGASEERAPKGHDDAGGSRRGEQSTPGGGRTSGSRDRGPGSSRPADARGKRKQGGTPPPSPPRGGGAVRASSRRPEGAVPTSQPEGERKKKRFRKMGETEPSRGNLISPPKWSFNRPPRSEIPSRPSRHSKPGQSEAEDPAAAEARRRESDRREAADRLREAEEAAQEAARARQAEETAREEAARARQAEEAVREEAARARQAEEAVREEAARARQAEEAAREKAGFRQDEALATSEAARDEAAGASLGPTPSGDAQATASGAAGDEAAGASLGPTPSGDAQDQPGPGDIPESGTSIGGPSRMASSPRRLFPTPSIAPLNAEPLLQALAAANTTVLDGLSAQVEALQAERAELDAAWAHVEEGRRSVEAMVEVGRKAHRRHVSELETRKKVLAEIAKEVEEERGAALIATTVMNEAQDTLRLQYGSWEAELGKKLDAAQGVLDAAAAREQRAAETEAASRRREEALEARAMALEERACVVERDLADREAAVTIREATLAAHEAACAEEELALRLREDALTERERALEGAEAAAQQLADSLSLREAAQKEQARRNLEGARAERAALNQRAAELEARAKELDARARSGGAAAGESDLAARLAAAEHTIADLQGALDSSAGEVEALRLAGEVGPGMLWDAVSRLDCAGRQVGLWRGRTVKYAANQGGLAQRLSKMAGALQRLPEELEKTIKSSSRDLAQGAVELVLASYQARDPNFSPWMALDEFPPGTEDHARAQVRDAADHIVDSFEGSAPRLAFAPNSDEEGNAGGADDSDDEAGDPGASD